MAIRSFRELREQAVRWGPRTVAVAGGESRSALAAVAAAAAAGMVRPILVGDPERIGKAMAEGGHTVLAEVPIEPAADGLAAAEGAARLAGEGRAEVLLKGQVRTDQLLRAVLEARHGLRTGSLLSDVLLYEDTLSGHPRLVAVTDGGINAHPTTQQLADIVRNAVRVMHALGFPEPRVALLSATEAVSDAVPSTRTAQALTALAETKAFGACRVFGPLALDNALLEVAARAKGIDSPVAGHADVMVAPCIDAGNILGKAVKYLARSICAHVVVGARVPVLIPSRVESAEDKLQSLALGVVMHGAAD